MSWNWYETQASQIVDERLAEAGRARLAAELRHAAVHREVRPERGQPGPADRGRQALGGFLRALGDAIDPA